MKDYYLSLTRSLFGYCVHFRAENEREVRLHAAEFYGRLWCSVYESPDGMEVINKNKPVEL